MERTHEETLALFARWAREDDDDIPVLDGQLIPANDDVIDDVDESVEGEFIASGEGEDVSDPDPPNTSSPDPFWEITDTGKLLPFNLRKLGRALGEFGFGQIKTHKTRTETPTIFRNRGNILELHDAMSVRRTLSGELEPVSEVNPDLADALIDQVLKLNETKIESALSVLTPWSTEGFEETEFLDVMIDTQDTCYLPFKNGVVVITKDSIELKDYEILGSRAIWESSIIDHEIDLSKLDRAKTRCDDVFKDFVHFALKQDVMFELDDLNSGYDKGATSPEYRSRKDAFETGYGYLIHNYNPPQNLKAVIFVDVDSSEGQTEGRNGKSLIQKTLDHYKPTVKVDGRLIRGGKSDSSRFNFSQVKMDTRVVIINDLAGGIDLGDFFSLITDDFTVKEEGKPKWTIPQEKKPKMAINTNFIPDGKGASYEGRQHIVEFGNYWNKVDISTTTEPQDILGKRLIEDFDSDDWDMFYTYGFECVQKYFKNGLMKGMNTKFELKKLIKEVEGVNGTGELTEWLINWCENDRVAGGYHIDGIKEEDLFRLYQLDRGVVEYAIGELPKSQKESFYKSLFQFCLASDGYEYNGHLSAKGNTRYQRRMRRGPKGNQETFALITHRDD